MFDRLALDGPSGLGGESFGQAKAPNPGIHHRDRQGGAGNLLLARLVIPDVLEGRASGTGRCWSGGASCLVRRRRAPGSREHRRSRTSPRRRAAAGRSIRRPEQLTASAGPVPDRLAEEPDAREPRDRMRPPGRYWLYPRGCRGGSAAHGRIPPHRHPRAGSRGLPETPSVKFRAVAFGMTSLIWRIAAQFSPLQARQRMRLNAAETSSGSRSEIRPNSGRFIEAHSSVGL